MTPTDQTTLALTGDIPFILITSGCLGLLVSFLLLQLYRRAVRRGMARTAGNSATFEAIDAARAEPPPPLAITYSGGGGRDPAVVDSSALSSRARTAPWRAGAVYGSAGALFSSTLTLAFLWSGGIGLRPLRFLMLFWVFVWPLVFTLSLVAAATRRERLLIATGYITGYCALAIVILIMSPDSSLSQLIMLWVYYDLPPSLLFSAFLLRRVRAVGPLVVTFLVFCISGISFLLDILAWSSTALRSVVNFLGSLGLGETGTSIAFIVISLTFFGAVGWVVLQWLRRGYQAK